MKEQFNALLLAAGVGKRLHPGTKYLPKCLFKVNGKPLLERWLNNLEDSNCRKVTINTHYKDELVRKHLSNRRQSEMTIEISHEQYLLGTAGTLKKYLTNNDDESLLVLHADNATNFDLKRLIRAHKNKPSSCVATLATFRTDSPSECGILEINNEGIIEKFYEKEADPKGNIANAAIYIFEKDFLDQVRADKTIRHDIAGDILKKMTGKLYTYFIDEVYIDVGKVDRLKKARKLLKD